MRIIALTLAFALSGCGGLGYAINNYSGVPIEKFAANGKTYRIFNKANESRLMITPTIADASAAGAIQGATLGLSGDVLGPQGEFRMAAQEFLDARQKGCVIADGAKIVQTQYEFFYRCA
ncbi:hypothetical protein [Paracoccus yeei]|uniref:hypothetical protein n=1 Tax=Paracoccus yeei TaxID=147645 RepID=UPI0028D5DE80|nr:hypothetical protein [Paracoccus yeei]